MRARGLELAFAINSTGFRAIFGVIVFNEHAFKLTGLDSDWNELTYYILEDCDCARLDDAVVPQQFSSKTFLKAR